MPLARHRVPVSAARRAVPTVHVPEPTGDRPPDTPGRKAGECDPNDRHHSSTIRHAGGTISRRGPNATERAGKEVTDVHHRPDLRRGDPVVHDLIAEIDEAIDAGDERRVEELSIRLRLPDPTAGAGA